jgi:hypothetical protein
MLISSLMEHTPREGVRAGEQYSESGEFILLDPALIPEVSRDTQDPTSHLKLLN